MLTIDKPFLHVSTSLTRSQVGQLIVALQAAEAELGAREALAVA
jgi:hypothetical protein